MGGSRSGRYGWRGEMEARRRIDIRQCIRRAWLRPGASGTYSWHNEDGESCGTVSYRVLAGALKLLYKISNGDGCEEVCVTIAIRRVPWRFGGERRYWACPNCWRYCEVVVMASHGRWWGCRKCLRLRYRSQALARTDRLERRADKLYARAGVEHDDGMIYKHKWMRWRTFNRLMNQANETSAHADAAFLWRLRRFGFLGVADALASVLGANSKA